MTRTSLLEKIADLAANIRLLEKSLVKAIHSRQMMDRLAAARAELDEALEDLRQLERE